VGSEPPANPERFMMEPEGVPRHNRGETTGAQVIDERLVLVAACQYA
jgi:hypothetical protein